jgi:hypothetical protein
MGEPTTAVFLNKTTPAPATGRQNVEFATNNATPQQSITASDPIMVGDTGAGGLAGNAPAPSAGDAAAGKFLKADGSWQMTQMVIGFMLAAATTGTAVTPPGRLVAPRSGLLRRCKVVVNTVDIGTVLTFRIKQNGTSVFTADNSVSTSTSVGAILTFTNLTSIPLPVAVDDVFTLDITSGSSVWSVTIQLE